MYFYIYMKKTYKMVKSFNKFINENSPREKNVVYHKSTEKVNTNKFNKIIDFTYLKDDANINNIEEICKLAIENSFYSVCVRPEFVSYAKNFLDRSEVKVCTVISFHEGTDNIRTKIKDTQDAILNGANEIDMVMNWQLLNKWTQEEDPTKKEDIESKIYEEVRKVADVCHGSNSIVLKVIIESGELTLDQIKKACEICTKAGTDYIKTSTGYYRGANLETVKFMRSILPEYVKIKASGGIRTFQDIENYVRAGADRVGTSSNPSILLNENVNTEIEYVDDDDLKEILTIVEMPTGECYKMEKRKILELNKYINWSQDYKVYIFREKDFKYIKDYIQKEISNKPLDNSPIAKIIKKKGKSYDQITYFDCHHKDLTNLEGVENLINLKTLICSNNNLTNLDEIENLRNLKFLICSYNNLTNLKGIENLPNLKTLNCSNNNFSNEYKQYLKEYCKKKNIDLYL